LDDEEHTRLKQLIRRAETLGDFPRPSLVEMPAWIVVIGWGRDDGPVTASRYGTPVKFSASSVDEVTRKLEDWIVEQDGDPPMR
jgi:hypothetical protein